MTYFDIYSTYSGGDTTYDRMITWVKNNVGRTILGAILGFVILICVLDYFGITNIKSHFKTKCPPVPSCPPVPPCPPVPSCPPAPPCPQPTEVSTPTSGVSTPTSGVSTPNVGVSAQSPGVSAQSPGVSAQSPGVSAQSPGVSAQSPGVSGSTSSFSNQEPFTNDLPYQLDNKSLTLLPDTDYSDFLQKMSLDQDVIKQHNQYVKDRNQITSTASFNPSRSDNQDVVTTWGLTKSTYVPVDPSARNVPSQNPEQGSKPVRLYWG